MLVSPRGSKNMNIPIVILNQWKLFIYFVEPINIYISGLNGHHWFWADFKSAIYWNGSTEILFDNAVPVELYWFRFHFHIWFNIYNDSTLSVTEQHQYYYYCYIRIVDVKNPSGKTPDIAESSLHLCLREEDTGMKQQFSTEV